MPPLALPLLLETSPLLEDVPELVDVCVVPSEQLGSAAIEAKKARETGDVRWRVFMDADAS
jgi:hypothetical protein